MKEIVDLREVQAEVRAWCESMAVPGQPGVFRFTPGGAPSFYACADMAIIRWCIGDDLKQLDRAERRAWIDNLNRYQNPDDGRYGPEMAHHLFHANGTAVNALCILGGQHRYPVAFYRLFDRPEVVGPWLSALDWGYDAWSTSHLVWGGPVCWNNSQAAGEEWRGALFAWLDRQLDPATGSWPRDFPPTTRESQAEVLLPLGCAVHLWPLWRHLGLQVPGVERLAELVLEWQGPAHDWGGIHYGSMDALYVLQVAIEQFPAQAPRYREALARFLPVLMSDFFGPRTTFENVHRALCWVSCLGYLQRGLPEQFTGDLRWGDIFDLKEVYDLDVVHPFAL